MVPDVGGCTRVAAHDVVDPQPQPFELKYLALLLSAVALGTPAFAQGGDDCSSATPISANGSYPFDTGAATVSGFMGAGVCAVAMNQDLFFEFTAPSAGDYQIDTFGSFFDTKLAVYSGAGCSATCLAYDDDANSTLQSQVDLAGVNAGDVLLIQVGGFNAAAMGSGDLNIGPSMSPCLVPDMFEENDDCPSAFPIADGTYTDLDVHTDDNDFYAVTVAAGATLTADILFLDVIADLDLYLWDPSVACDTNILGTGAMTGWLVRGYSANDNESISYTNATASSQNLVLEVDMFTGGGACNGYDPDRLGKHRRPGDDRDQLLHRRSKFDGSTWRDVSDRIDRCCGEQLDPRGERSPEQSVRHLRHVDDARIRARRRWHEQRQPLPGRGVGPIQPAESDPQHRVERFIRPRRRHDDGAPGIGIRLDHGGRHVELPSVAPRPRRRGLELHRRARDRVQLM